MSACIKKISRCFVLCCALVLWNADGFAQLAKKYSISKGAMQIVLSKELKETELDAFIKQYDLSDLALKKFIKTNFEDSLKSQGWKVEVNNKEMIVITKPLFSAETINDPAERITFAGIGNFSSNYPAPMNNQVFGFNVLRSNRSFVIKDSTITFRVRADKNTRQMLLAGNFTNWYEHNIPMKRTDSGWVVTLSLPPGKYLYKYIADGNWFTDPENVLAENDGEGNTNSVFYMPNTNFRLDGFTNAKRVFISGSFNEWKENKTRLNKTASGWELDVYLMPGTYTYRYLADKNWMIDPGNSRKLPNEFGEYNSVVSVGKPMLFKLSGHQDAKNVFLAGSFNKWRNFEIVMSRTDSGWQVPYTLGEGNYEFKYFADGQWLDGEGRPSKPNLPGSILVTNANYTFRLKNFQEAKNVFVAGDFNGWSPNGYRMRKEGDEWVISLHLAKGKHLYKFVIDDKWIKDPGNELWEENEYGTGNSVMWIGN